MAKANYAVVDGKTRKVKKQYCVVGGQTKKIKKVYDVVDGKTRLCFSSGSGYVWNTIDSSLAHTFMYGDAIGQSKASESLGSGNTNIYISSRAWQGYMICRWKGKYWRIHGTASSYYFQYSTNLTSWTNVTTRWGTSYKPKRLTPLGNHLGVLAWNGSSGSGFQLFNESLENCGSVTFGSQAPQGPIKYALGSTIMYIADQSKLYKIGINSSTGAASGSSSTTSQDASKYGWNLCIPKITETELFAYSNTPVAASSAFGYLTSGGAFTAVISNYTSSYGNALAGIYWKNKYFAYFGSKTLVSTNGTSWTTYNSVIPLSNTANGTYYGITYDDDTLYCSINYAGYGYAIAGQNYAYSKDGITWTLCTDDSTKNIVTTWPMYE